MTTFWTRELLPSRREPKDGAEQHDQPCRCRSVVHVLAIHRCGTGEVRDDAHEYQEQETNDVQHDSPSTERVRALESRLLAGEVCDDACEQRHGVGKI